MTSEIERLLAHQRAQTWTKFETAHIKNELERLGVFIPVNRWPYKMACSFYRSHGSDSVENNPEATKAIRQLARRLDVSEEFMFCVCALGFLAQDTIADGFTVAVAVANSAVVAEPFRIVCTIGQELPFWKPIKEDV